VHTPYLGARYSKLYNAYESLQYITIAQIVYNVPEVKIWGIENLLYVIMQCAIWGYCKLG